MARKNPQGRTNLIRQRSPDGPGGPTPSLCIEMFIGKRRCSNSWTIRQITVHRLLIHCRIMLDTTLIA